MRCAVREVSGEKPVMDFIASDDSIDRYNEVIEQNGWQLENFRANPVIPDCHDYSSIARILGRAVSVSAASGKLLNRVEFCLDNPLGNMAYKMAKNGFINSQSVGFIPIEWTNGDAGEPDRTYTKCELLEISLVVVPANPGATVEATAIGKALRAGALEKTDLSDAIKFLQHLITDKSTRKEVSETLEIISLARRLKRMFQKTPS